MVLAIVIETEGAAVDVHQPAMPAHASDSVPSSRSPLSDTEMLDGLTFSASSNASCMQTAADKPCNASWSGLQPADVKDASYSTGSSSCSSHAPKKARPRLSDSVKISRPQPLAAHQPDELVTGPDSADTPCIKRKHKKHKSSHSVPVSHGMGICTSLRLFLCELMALHAAAWLLVGLATLCLPTHSLCVVITAL